uniref:Uncharacterized protein n=1 Tax=virus sp. ctBM815 TaxID=2825806 RepID=A0A8S5RKY6_9VIRU|nr:MAG TPA: hypothetical protein [virus sp. ctBM815]
MSSIAPALIIIRYLYRILDPSLTFAFELIYKFRIRIARKVVGYPL